MLEIQIPEFGTLALEHLVLDHNGTLAQDGLLIDGVRERLAALAPRLRVHVVTADTFGNAQAQLRGVAGELVVLPSDRQAQAKRALVERLGASRVVAIGNGRNDRLMLEAAALGIVVMQKEGAAAAAVAAADVATTSILDALDLIANPLRLVATLRG